MTTTGISFCHIYFSVAKKQRTLKLLSYLEKRKGGREKENGRGRRRRKKNRKEFITNRTKKKILKQKGVLQEERK